MLDDLFDQMWESVLAVLLPSPAGRIIDEVWAWESVQHGDAALINAGNLSAVCARSCF